VFITHEALKVKLPETPWFAQNEGSRGMELNFAIPWFVVALHVPERGLWFDRTLIALDVLATIALYRRIYVGSYVKRLDVMLPAHMTREDSWKMLEVSELWSAVHSHSADSQVWLVRTSDGELIQCPYTQVPVNQLENRSLVYSVLALTSDDTREIDNLTAAKVRDC